MKRLLLILFLFGSLGTLNAQQYFNKTYGGINHDIGRKIIKDTDLSKPPLETDKEKIMLLII